MQSGLFRFVKKTSDRFFLLQNSFDKNGHFKREKFIHTKNKNDSIKILKASTYTYKKMRKKLLEFQS